MTQFKRVAGVVRVGALVAVAGLAIAMPSAARGDDRGVPPADNAESAVAIKPASEQIRQQVFAARDRVFPALVNIRVTTVSYWGGKEQKDGSNGSGTLITEQGHIVTNQHVIDRGVKFVVTMADKTEIEADLVGEDPLTDLAVIKLRLDKLPAGTKLPVASWGDSTKLAVGDTVLAMGSPFSLSRSVTLGVVSNTERVFYNTWTNDRELEPDEIDGQTTGIFTRWIQHDALINPGNSGGPLVNLAGEIIGINTRGGAGMGFASPSLLAREVATSLIEKGEVIRSDIGVSLKPIEKTGLDRGVLVNSVVQNPPGPASRGGIRAGDVITAVNGEPITVRFVEQVPDLLRRIATKAPGTTIKLDYLRNGQPGSAEVVIEKLLRERGDESALRAWGISIVEITERIARERRLPSREGVIISGVRGGSPAALAEPALSWGDIIREIDGQPVKNVGSIIDVYKKMMTAGADKIPENMLVRFDRQGKDHVTLVKPRPRPKEDPPREVPKAWVGVAVQPVLRELAKSLGFEGTTGFRITRVYPRTVAAGSELKVGDVVTAINGEKLSPRTMQDAGQFGRRIRQLKIDEPVTLSVLREGKPVDVKLTLERTRIGPDEARKDENKDFELSVRELTFFDRDDNNWDESINGVLVESAEAAGWAGQGGLSSGDLIIRIDQTDITDIATYRKAMEEVTTRQPERVVFVVLRGVNTSFKFVEPEWKPKAVDNK
ncbi:MAG: PDZ domain-containing protein [Phycisphaerales bacterium]|jgi:serine protease Do|nr:PDZ domain-containing protein [Phycisphaerales bacterium]